MLLQNTQYFYTFVNNYLSVSLRKDENVRFLLWSWSFLQWIGQHCVFILLWLLFRCYSVYFCISVTLPSWNVHPKMAAAIPKRHLVAVTQKASEFRLLVFYTLWYNVVSLASVPSIQAKLRECETMDESLRFPLNPPFCKQLMSSYVWCFASDIFLLPSMLWWMRNWLLEGATIIITKYPSYQ